MDDADRAEERIEQVVEDGLAAVRRASGSGLVPVGVCHCCGEPVDGRRLFCDARCAQDWEGEQRMRRLAGVR